MYIIQTNRTTTDFQSYMYEIDVSWDKFKVNILHELSSLPIKETTLSDYKENKTRLNKTVIKQIINDDFHLEVVFDDNTASSYMQVNNEFFKNH